MQGKGNRTFSLYNGKRVEKEKLFRDNKRRKRIEI